MNLRNKFIWNMSIIFASISLIWYSWALYNINFSTNELLDNYKNDKRQEGVDVALENKVNELEEIYTYRVNKKFKNKKNPFDLSRVLATDMNFGRNTKFWVSGIINRPNGSSMAILNYMNETFNVTKGDSIAGGVIENITSTEVIYRKNDRLHYFNLGVNSNIK